MKVLRFLLRSLLAVALVAAVVVGVFLLPPVQTWLVQRALARHPEWHAEVGGCSAFWSRVGISDFTLQVDRASFSAPSVELRIPLWPVLRHRGVEVQTLVAKGWMLDLTGGKARAAASSARPHGRPAESAGPLPAAVQATARLVRTMLAQTRVTDALTIAAVELEGDVYVPAGPDREATPVHVKLSGGPLAPGRDAEFAVTASAQPPVGALRQIATRGRLRVGVTTMGEISALRLHLDTTATPVSGAAEMQWTNELALARGTGGESYSLRLEREGRSVMRIEAKHTAARIEGNWSTALQAADLNQSFALSVPESFSAKGEGAIDSDAALAGVHVAGHLEIAGWPAGAVMPGMGRAGLVKAALNFDLNDDGRSMRLERCDGTAGVAEPVIEWRLIQPVEVGSDGGTFVPADTDAGWLELGVHAVPASWLAASDERFTLPAGTVSGQLAVRSTGTGVAVRTIAPLQLAGISIASAAGPLLEAVDGTVAGSAEKTSQQWEIRLEPLVLTQDGRPVASVTAKLTRASGDAQPLTVTASWQTDLDALARQPLNRAGWLRGRSMTGEFSGTTQSWLDGEGAISVVGHDPGRTLSAKISLQAEPDGSLSLTAPLTIAFGSEQSVFTAKVDWTAKDGRVQADLTGSRAVVEHLRLFAAPLLGLTHVFRPTGESATDTLGGASGAPAQPFWGGWVGRLDTNFDELNLDGREYVNVGGTFRFDHRSLSLEGGRGKLPPPKPAKLGRRTVDDESGTFDQREPRQTPVRFSGAIAFDPLASPPYRLTGTMAREGVDATQVFPAPKEGADAPFEGVFDLTCTYSGTGATVADLTARLRQEVKFRSSTGIVRLLTANIAASLPQQKDSAAGNALSGFGTAAGWLFGNSKAFAGSGEIKVSKTTEAVLDFRNSIREIGYDEFTGTVVAEPDGRVQLLNFALTSKDEHLTGFGTLGPGAGRPLRDRPLSFMLEFGARGRIAGLLSTANLLSDRNDAAGYLLLKQPVHFGGTLAAIDDREWRDLLVKAALAPPAGSSKR